MFLRIACRQVGDLNHRQISLHSDPYRYYFSALKMPTCGHAVVKRAKWFSPAAQQILLWIESIKPKRLNAAGSYYRVFPKTTRRQRAIFYRPETLSYLSDHKKTDELPEITTACFYESHAGK